MSRAGARRTPAERLAILISAAPVSPGVAESGLGSQGCARPRAARAGVLGRRRLPLTGEPARSSSTRSPVRRFRGRAAARGRWCEHAGDRTTCRSLTVRGRQCQRQRDRGCRLGFVRRPGRRGLVQRAGAGRSGRTYSSWRSGGELGSARVRSARARCAHLRTGRGSRRLRAHRCRHSLLQLHRSLLGLKRLEGAQRAPELGYRRPAIAQQRLERARAVAVADQREPKPAIARPRRSSNSSASMRSARARRQAATATRRASTVWSAPTGASSSTSAASSAANSARVLVRQHDVLLRAHAVLERILCRARALPSGVFGPRDFAPFLRLASARALLTGRPRAARQLHST